MLHCITNILFVLLLCCVICYILDMGGLVSHSMGAERASQPAGDGPGMVS